MRRATLLRLIGVVLVVGFGAYSVFWWIAAGKIEEAAGAWAQAAHERKLDVSWQAIRVAGYPFSFRVELSDVVATDKAADPAPELRAPSVAASIWPWRLNAGWFTAPSGVTALYGSAAAPLAKLSATGADGAAALAGDGGTTVWLTLHHPTADAGITVSARTADIWVIVPPHAPAAHTESGIAAAALLAGLSVPTAPPGFGNTVDELGFGVTMMGAWPPGPLRQAAAAGRDDGGTAELDHFDLRWGELAVTGSGTLALDSDLQPVGGFSGAVAGYDQLMNGLVAAGRLKASDARVARLALAMLGKAGPDGRPEISTSFTIQNGEMFLGPAKLGKAPHIDW
jgi:hypothetical protein